MFRDVSGQTFQFSHKICKRKAAKCFVCMATCSFKVATAQGNSGNSAKNISLRQTHGNSGKKLMETQGKMEKSRYFCATRCLLKI